MAGEPAAVGKSERHEKSRGGTFAAAFATLVLASAGGEAASSGEPATAVPHAAVSFEAVPGGLGKRVILSARAAERLGIETGSVGEQVVVRTQMAGGLVVPAMEKTPERKPAGGGLAAFGHVAAASAARPVAPRATANDVGDVWILVTLSPAEGGRLAKDRPARLHPLALREGGTREILAQPSGLAPVEDLKHSMLSHYYVVPGRDHGLTPNTRMRVELPLLDSGGLRKVVPYGAVYYDGSGNACVYVAARPLAFERQRVTVERVTGELAVLSEGPPVGTTIVTVGAALLYGAELFGR